MWLDSISRHQFDAYISRGGRFKHHPLLQQWQSGPLHLISNQEPREFESRLLHQFASWSKEMSSVNHNRLAKRTVIVKIVMQETRD